MQNKVLLQFKRFDGILLAATLLLIALGLLILYSSGLRSSVTASQLDTSRQILYVAVGFVLFWMMAKVDYNLWGNYSRILYIVMLVLLLIVEIFV